LRYIRVKVKIAREIFDAIAQRNGQFLRKIESIEEGRSLGVPMGMTAWVKVSEDAAMKKIKQVLRHCDPLH
jgi:hypothetical protein